MKAIIIETTVEMKTPIGNIVVRELESDKALSFSVCKNRFYYPYDIYDDNGKVIDTLETENNYQLSISTSILEIGKTYYIKFTGGKLQSNTGDAHYLSMTGTYAGKSIGIGAYNPNEYEELEQAFAYSERKGLLENRIIQSPSSYDMTNFREYALDRLEDMSGYSFHMLDKSKERVYFNVAWLDNKYYDVLECESAIDFWIS